jgi:predicted ArsR family transcriptional regulator
MQSKWAQRFFDSTRGKVVSLLRQRRQTVDELAQHLDLTDNAVRSHLSALERDGLVRQDGLRRGPNKPSFVYDLTPAAEELFPKAYHQVLDQLLVVLNTEMGEDAATQLMRRIGEDLAPEPLAPTLPREERLERGLALIGELGGVAQLETENGTTTITGASCPLSAVAVNHAEVCHLTASMLTSYTGVKMCANCDRHDRPTCRFSVAS